MRMNFTCPYCEGKQVVSTEHVITITGIIVDLNCVEGDGGCGRDYRLILKKDKDVLDEFNSFMGIFSE